MFGLMGFAHPHLQHVDHILNFQHEAARHVSKLVYLRVLKDIDKF